MAIFRTLTFLFVSSLIGFMKNDVNGAPVTCPRPTFKDPYAIVLNPDQPTYQVYFYTQITCEEGHTPNGLPTNPIYCGIDGTWSTYSTGALCYAQCNTTKLINDDDIKATNGDGVLQTVYNHGTTANFECTDQGQFSGSDLATCNNGTLDYNSVPKCLAYCPINLQVLGEGLYYDIADDPVITDTPIIYYRDDDVITYRCSVGYEGPINCTSCTSTCDDGTWDPPDIPTCLPPVCHRPVFTNPYAIVLNPDKPTYINNYDLLELTCEEGHTSYALPNSMYCNPDGIWSTDPTAGLCYADCNTTKLIDDDIKAIDDDGTVQTVFIHGTTAKFECKNQGQFSGSEVATCNNGTFYYSSEPSCLAYCPINPQELGEGLYYDIAEDPVMNETDTFYYRDDDVITYRCSVGYEGPINCTSCTSTCTDGTWNPPDIPTCTEINECNSNPCQNNAACTNLINEYTCQCLDGFNGTNCENNIDDCVRNECQNGATCVDGVDSYECQCPDGYNGTLCERDIDECSSDPCQNGGICTDLLNGFNCTCAPGYMGYICDEDIDDCENNECQNGATCLDKVDSYECQCQDGYSGTICENDIDECSSEPCGNGATCTDLVNGFNCTCAPGYMGDTCEKGEYSKLMKGPEVQSCP